MNLMEHVKERLSIFKNLYDTIRIVDPVNKKTIIINEDSQEEIEGTCFDFWRKRISCDNCISMRAYLNNDTFVKIQHDEGKTYLMTATPIDFNDSVYIIEMLKDITTKGIVVDNKNNKSTNIEELIKEMSEKAIKDGLTGIFNRRYINERLPVEINKSINEGKPLSIIMADIDLFKNVNDTYGHLMGDKILIQFADLMTKSIRSNMDWLGRYGGEEFLIVLTNTDCQDAFIVAEKIRKLVEETVFCYEGTSIHITSSFGVYGIKDQNLSLDELIARVDKNLYAAKESGRNKSIASV